MKFHIPTLLHFHNPISLYKMGYIRTLKQCPLQLCAYKPLTNAEKMISLSEHRAHLRIIFVIGEMICTYFQLTSIKSSIQNFISQILFNLNTYGRMKLIGLQEHDWVKAKAEVFQYYMAASTQFKYIVLVIMWIENHNLEIIPHKFFWWLN